MFFFIISFCSLEYALFIVLFSIKNEDYLFLVINLNCLMGLFSSKQENIILQEYSKNPVYNNELKNFTIQYHEGNFICGDDITVFLKIEGDKIVDYGYTGNLSTVSLASAGFLSEFLFDVTLNDILVWNYEFLSEKGFEVSTKRKRASVLPVLALRNAIHQYLSDGKTDDFDDLIEE